MFFQRIQQPHPYLNTLKSWYETAFPTNERRSFDDLLQLLSYPDMHLCALVDNEQPVGLMIYWVWPGVLYIEHFAIDPARRGQQLGQQALAQLLQLDSSFCILEVELPADELSQRRIRFYERQGFSLNAFAYEQPPYQPGSLPVPMRLMSRPAITSQEAFDQYSQLIKERVYERFYPAPPLC